MSNVPQFKLWFRDYAQPHHLDRVSVNGTDDLVDVKKAIAAECSPPLNHSLIRLYVVLPALHKGTATLTTCPTGDVPDLSEFEPWDAGRLVRDYFTQDNESDKIQVTPPHFVHIYYTVPSTMKETSLTPSSDISLRFKDKVLATHRLHGADLANIQELRKTVSDHLAQFSIAWKTVNLFYRHATANQRSPWIRLTRDNFHHLVSAPGKVYATDLDTVDERDISAPSLGPDVCHAESLERAFGALVSNLFPSGDDETYKPLGMAPEPKQAFVLLHRLMRQGALIIMDEVQVANELLPIAVATKEPFPAEPNRGQYLFVGTPRLGGSRLPDLHSTSENKLGIPLEVPRLQPSEMLAFARMKLGRDISSAEFAYLYAFTGGHVRSLNRALEEALDEPQLRESLIVNDEARLAQLSREVTEIEADYCQLEMNALLKCAQKHQRAAPIPDYLVRRPLHRDAVVEAADVISNQTLFKIADPMLHTALNVRAAGLGNPSVRSLIGTVVERLVEEILMEIKKRDGNVIGVPLGNYEVLRLGVTTLDIDTVLVQRADDEDGKIVSALLFNTKFSMTLLTEKTIKEFDRNVAKFQERYPSVLVQVVHLSMVDDNAKAEDVAALLAGSTAVHWRLEDLVSALEPAVADATARISTDNGHLWVHRRVEDSLDSWCQSEKRMSRRFSGHAGNGKTVLALRCGKKATSRRLVLYYNCALRRGIKL